MFCSTIIPTIDRPSLVRAVKSILDQEFSRADFEVIVVNDSGRPLHQADWQTSTRVRVIDTNRRERSVARNVGAAMARGKYLNFLDDDDVLLPGALNAFWQLSRLDESAIWLNGSYQTVDNDGNVLEEIHPEIQGNNFALLVGGEGIPLQASLVDAKHFHKLGGFDPTITGVEDRDLGRRMAMTGEIAYTSSRVAQIRIGLEGSTTNWTILAEDDRRSRERALNPSNSLTRLWDSTKSCLWHGKILRAYWQGRVCRAYIASVVWNLQKQNFLTALGRALQGLAFVPQNIISSDFWRGLRKIDLIADGRIESGRIFVQPDPLSGTGFPIVRDDPW